MKTFIKSFVISICFLFSCSAYAGQKFVVVEVADTKGDKAWKVMEQSEFKSYENTTIKEPNKYFSAALRASKEKWAGIKLPSGKPFPAYAINKLSAKILDTYTDKAEADKKKEACIQKQIKEQKEAAKKEARRHQLAGRPGNEKDAQKLKDEQNARNRESIAIGIFRKQIRILMSQAKNKK